MIFLLLCILFLYLRCVYCPQWGIDLSRVWCNWLLPHFNFADRVFCHSCHNFRVPLFLKVRHNAGWVMREFLCNLEVCIEIQTTLYTLVYTLFLDNDKYLTIFGVCLEMFFWGLFLDKTCCVVRCCSWMLYVLLRCCVYFVVTICCVTFICGFLSEDLSRSSSNSFNWISYVFTVLSGSPTCPAYGVTDYYPILTLQIVFFVILVIILGCHFFWKCAIMQAGSCVNSCVILSLVLKFKRVCTRWYIHFF